MISVQIAKQSFWDTAADGYLFLLNENLDGLAQIQEHYPNLEAILEKNQYTGKKGQCVVLTGERDGSLVQFIFVGLGKQEGSWHDELEYLRRNFACLLQRSKKLKITNAVFEVPDAGIYNIDAPELIKQLTLTAHMADYEFTAFKSKQKQEHEITLHLAMDDASGSDAVAVGEIIGRATTHTRSLADTPPNVATPSYLAERAQEIAKRYKLKLTIIEREEALKMGMGGFCAVDAGSDQDGKFLVLEYNAPKAKKTIAVVGKGVTFDSGGLSLKPAAYMTGMKYDMSGAAATLGILSVVGELKPNVNVVGIMPCVENLPSGSSSKQDEVATFLNGKTAEIENTDAEGRLILADALVYAEQNFSPDVIIDLATLTGACVISLGHTFTGLMTRDDELAQTLGDLGLKTGDRNWRLPLHDDYKPAIKSAVADITNSGRRDYGAGSITGALFLENFVEKTPWAHLDIAGTADGVHGVNYLGKGATAAGVRIMVEYILTQAK